MANVEQLLSKEIPKGNGSKPRLLREGVYDRLKEAIREGQLQPGEPLSETRLANAFDISRTPIREALQQLAQEGLVQKMPNQTVRVAAPTMQEVLNILHVRSLLEPKIVRLATESISAEALNILWDAVDRMTTAAEQNDRSTWIEVDTVYHETLSSNCPNALLGQLGLQMRNRMQLTAADSQTSTSRLIEGTHEHRKVIEAIAEGDGQAAEKAMQEHLRVVRSSIFNRLAPI